MYIRLCGGRAPNGQFGVEAWFIRQPCSDGIHFTPDVVFYDPRTLAVHVKSRYLRAVLVVIHAPVAHDPGRDDWWCALHSTLRRVVGDLPLVLLGDWNTRFSASLRCRIGDLVFPSKHLVPSHISLILEAFDTWLPSTYSSCHPGTCNTWHAPGATAAARLDYAGIPCDWCVGCDGSRVLHDVDLGHRSVNHLAVKLEVWVPAGFGTPTGARSASLDRAAMRSDEGIATIHEGAPVIEWQLDASSHFHRLETYFGEELRAAFPARRRRRQESFLSDSSWVLRDHRVFLRRGISHFRERFKQPDLLAAFRALRSGRSLGAMRCVVAAVLCGESKSVAASVGALQDTKQQLRRALRADKRHWTASLVQQALESPTQDIVRQLRPLVQSRARGPGCRRGLPVVRLESGELAQDEDEAMDRWVRHFAGNEGGTRCSPEEVRVMRRPEMKPSVWMLGSCLLGATLRRP